LREEEGGTGIEKVDGTDDHIALRRIPSEDPLEFSMRNSRAGMAVMSPKMVIAIGWRGPHELLLTFFDSVLARLTLWTVIFASEIIIT